MQNPTEEAEIFIPTETVLSNGPNVNPTVAVRRKAAKRSESWYQNLAVPLSIPARKKPRIAEPLPTTTTDEAARITASTDVSVGIPPPNPDPVTDTQPNADRWTPEEDAKLTNALTKTCKKKRGKEYTIDWLAVATLVPGRTKDQCRNRWTNNMEPKALGGRTKRRRRGRSHQEHARPVPLDRAYSHERVSQ
jgi:hypothetical protein